MWDSHPSFSFIIAWVIIGSMIIVLGPYQGIEIFLIWKTSSLWNHDSVTNQFSPTPYQKPHTWDATVDGVGCTEHNQIAWAPYLEDKTTCPYCTWWSQRKRPTGEKVWHPVAFIRTLDDNICNILFFVNKLKFFFSINK